MDDDRGSQTKIELVIDASIVPTQTSQDLSIVIRNRSVMSIITRLHAGYFRISLSLCGQALLWKTLGDQANHSHSNVTLLSSAFILLWSISLFILLTLSLLYILRCFFHFNMVKAEFLHDVGVNYLFAPWISWLLLLQSVPFFTAKTVYYLVLWRVFAIPVVLLDVKIYGQWFTKGKKFLSTVANPTSQLSVIANLASARGAAQMGWKESAVCMFSLGMAHYLVLFVTLYQRLSGSDRLPAMLRPVFFLFIATPSMASLAWDSISGTFDTASKMLFFLSLFIFVSLVARPTLFKKSMRRFNVAWWAYSFPLTVLALASTKYVEEEKGNVAHGIMFVLLALSVLVSLGLTVVSVLNARMLLLNNDPILSHAFILATT